MGRADMCSAARAPKQNEVPPTLNQIRANMEEEARYRGVPLFGGASH